MLDAREPAVQTIARFAASFSERGLAAALAKARGETGHRMRSQMPDDSKPVETIPPARPPARGVAPSTTQRLIEEMIALRESTGRQLKFFEQTIRQLKDESTTNFNNFVGETTRAYQSMRQEL